MPPPKKRRKADEAKTAAASGPEDEPVSTASIDRALEHFITNLDESGEANQALLSVKCIQRSLLSQLEQVEQRLESKHVQVEKHRDTLANLNYEQGHWESKIQHLQQASKTHQLEALCREELDDNMSEGPEVIQKFLNHDIAQPDHEMDKVVNILHQQINHRGTLERNVSQRQMELKNLEDIRKKRTQFLNQLPDKLKDMERASLSLQKFFAMKQKMDDHSDEAPAHATFNTSDRETRLRLAQRLSGPLYTLLVQLQSYTDDYPHKGLALDIVSTPKTLKSDDIWKDPDENTVVFHVPIPQIQSKLQSGSGGRASPNLGGGGKKDRTSISFTYFSAHNVVTAKVSGGDDRLNPSTLLQLNPHDTGDFQVKGDLKTVESKCPYGKPYLWCNYLAGLQLVKGQNPMELLEGSTRVILMELLRKVQSNMILHYMLNRVLPSQPRGNALPPNNRSNSKDQPQCLARVASFQLTPRQEQQQFSNGNGNNDDDAKIYTLQLKRGNHSFKATVRIHLAQYPVLAPQWSLTGNDLNWGQEYGSHDSLHQSGNSNATGAEAPPLHQARLGALETRVNDVDKLIAEMKEEASEEEVDESYYYDWILSHQIREIIQEWDAWVSAESESANPGNGSHTRSVRGRDRAKVE